MEREDELFAAANNKVIIISAHKKWTHRHHRRQPQMQPIITKKNISTFKVSDAGHGCTSKREKERKQR